MGADKQKIVEEESEGGLSSTACAVGGATDFSADAMVLDENESVKDEEKDEGRTTAMEAARRSDVTSHPLEASLSLLDTKELRMSHGTPGN